MKQELEKVTLNLRKGDFERLRELHPDMPGAGFIVRQLVSNHIDKKENELLQKGRVEVDI